MSFRFVINLYMCGDKQTGVGVSKIKGDECINEWCSAYVSYGFGSERNLKPWLGKNVAAYNNNTVTLRVTANNENCIWVSNGLKSPFRGGTAHKAVRTHFGETIAFMQRI